MKYKEFAGGTGCFGRPRSCRCYLWATIEAVPFMISKGKHNEVTRRVTDPGRPAPASGFGHGPQGRGRGGCHDAGRRAHRVRRRRWGSSDGGGGVMATQVSWAYRDNNDGAFGPGGDLNSVYNAFTQTGVSMLPEGVAHAQEALNEANGNCTVRFNEAHPNQVGQAQCRMVSVGVITEHDQQFNCDVHHQKSDWLQAWAAGL